MIKEGTHNNTAIIKELLSQYRAKSYIVNHIREDLLVAERRAAYLKSPRLDGLPHVRDIHGSENKVLDEYYTREKLIERYKAAKDYMDAISSILDDLPEMDRRLIEVFYINEDGDGGTNKIDVVCEEFGLERTAAYKRVERALRKFGLRFFGC